MFMSLLGFGMGVMFSNFHVCGMMFYVMVYMLVKYMRPKGIMCFRCLIFNLSGPVLFL